eukprot:jgi/Psemu1/261395/estExt_Genewise1Plus.C_5750037
MLRNEVGMTFVISVNFRTTHTYTRGVVVLFLANTNRRNSSVHRATQLCNTAIQHSYPTQLCNTAMQHSYATQLCNTAMQHSYATQLCNTAMQHSYATQLCNTAMQHSYATQLCNTAMQHSYATQLCNNRNCITELYLYSPFFCITNMNNYFLEVDNHTARSESQQEMPIEPTR